MHSTDFTWLSDEALIKRLTLRDKRPHLMIVAHGLSLDAVTDRLMVACRQPVLPSVLPGRLHLPASRRGTVLLQNVAALSLSQQIVLTNWIDEGDSDAQIVSISPTPLWQLVKDGDFLEGLFYRLNVICLAATAEVHDVSDDDTGEHCTLPRA